MADRASETTLVADIGGTNTRVALADGGAVREGSVRRYANAEAASISAVLEQYLDETGTDRGAICGACVAGAGPVRDGVVTLTNLDWRVGPEELRAVLDVPRLAVLNDLQAQGHALGASAPGTVTEILAGERAAEATQLVIGVGTGFNIAPVYQTPAGRFVVPSEAGHVSLPDIGGDAARVVAALRDSHGFAAVEEALSGRGIGNVHAALHGQTGKASEIMQALEAGDAKAEATVRMVVRLLGAVAGDLALTTLPFGGISLVGGVSRNLAPYLDRFGFAEAMRDKGRFGSFVSQFSVDVVTDDYAALTGCASHLAEMG